MIRISEKVDKSNTYHSLLKEELLRTLKKFSLSKDGWSGDSQLYFLHMAHLMRCQTLSICLSSTC